MPRISKYCDPAGGEDVLLGVSLLILSGSKWIQGGYAGQEVGDRRKKILLPVSKAPVQGHKFPQHALHRWWSSHILSPVILSRWRSASQISSLLFSCHSKLDPESNFSDFDSRLRENDVLGMNVKKRETHYASACH
jgi:hypothetical protein